MSFISWNCRGVGCRRKDTALKILNRRHSCLFLGLTETKHTNLPDFKVRSWWGHSDVGWEETPAIEGGGGVIACWDKSKFVVTGCSKGDRWVQVEGVLKEWDFSCEIMVVYGPNSRAGRLALWKQLIDARGGSSNPLLVMGDFNEVRKSDERNGVSCLQSIMDFREWSDSMGIEDVPLLGRRFTWTRGKSRSRLDRVFLDQEWGFKFPNATLTALPNSMSDHSPIHLSLAKQDAVFPPFRNLDAWFSHPGFGKMVREEWNKLGDMTANRKLKELHIPIKRWNKVHFGNIEAKIKLFEEEQLKIHAKMDRGDNNQCDFARLAAVEAQLSKWLDRKTSYWKQMSRDKWIKQGDRNTKYFHAIAVGKRRFKRIDQIKWGRRILKRPQEIKMEILRFYKNLYRQKPLPRIHLDEFLFPKISEEQRSFLEKRPSQEEINAALQNCDSSKAPGYDGFNFRFVKEMWKDIGKDVSRLIYDFFDSGRLPKEVNRTWVTLIPKMEGAVEVKDFRPISMIGSIYKIIAKILAARLSKVLPNLIGET